MRLKDPIDDLGDPAERRRPVQKGRDRHFVGRVEHCGRRPGGASGGHAHVEGPKHLPADRLERERPRRNRIEPAHPGVGETRRMGERVQNRELHGGKPELRDHAAVAELHEGVDDALGVDHHLERVVGKPEQIVGLDQLERLVHQRRAVHGDLLSHAPGGVAQSLDYRRLGYPLGRPFAERPAGAGEDQPAQSAVPPGDALKHPAVLGVHRHHFPTAGAGRLHHQVAGHDQTFLVGQGDPLAQPERRERGVEPGRAHHGVHHDADVGMGRRLHQDVGAAGPALVLPGEREAGVGGPPRGHLRGELLAVSSAGEGHHPEVVALAPEHLERAPSDGAGGAEHRDADHQMTPKARYIAAATGTTK
jgi:hypothetical protein